MKTIGIVIGLFLALCIVQNASAINEYNTTDGRGFLLFQETAFSEPLDPRIACEPSGIHCLMMVYENNTFFGRGVRVLYSTDFFVTIREVIKITVDFSSYASGYYDNFHLPYDVSYVSAEGKYYLFIFNTVYSTDGSTTTNEGNFVSNEAGKAVGLGFKNSTRIRGMEAIISVGSSATISKLKGTVLGGDGIGTSPYSFRATWAPSSSLKQYDCSYDGSSCLDQGSITGCTSTTTCQANVSLGTFPTTFTGLDYFANNQVGYQRFDNSSWNTGTTDLLSYDSPTLTYAWNLTGIAENITNTDSFITTSNQIYAYRRESNDTTSGVWIYNIPLSTIRFLGEGFDPSKETTENVNLSVTLNCSAESFTTTTTGTLPSITTPCTDEGNEIVIETFSGFRPVSYTIPNYTIVDNCIGLSSLIRTDTTKAFFKSYDFTVTYFDSLFGTRIDGVTAILDTDTETSDTNGQAIFSVFPIVNESFSIENFPSSCASILTFTGSQKIFNLISSKSGYNTQTETLTLADPPFDIEEGDFTTSKNVILVPLNTEVEVRLFSKDGIEIFPSRVQVFLEGSNDTFWELNNELFETNVASILPATFFLINNTGTYEINVTVVYFGNFTAFANVTNGEKSTIDIFINSSSWELPCNTISDCSPDVCVGNIFKRLLSCTANQCTYQSFNCGTPSRCDKDLGCVDLVSTTNCTRDSQCTNNCTDDFTMINNKCGADGFCKGTFVECLETCNSTLGYCEELAQCVLRNEMEFKAGYVRRSDSVFIGGTVNAFCDFSNANKYTCGFPDGLLVRDIDLRADGSSINDLIAFPEGWVVDKQENDDIIFRGVSIFCDQFCNMSWVFCEHGCDPESGRCRGIDKLVDDTGKSASVFNNLFAGFWNWYNTVFPDQNSKSFLWLVYGIIIIVAINMINMSVIPKGARVHIGREFDIVLLLAWIAVGSIIGQFWLWVFFAIAAVAIYYVITFIVKKQTGDGG